MTWLICVHANSLALTRLWICWLVWYPKKQFLQNTEEYLSEYIEMFPIFGYHKIELWISKNRIMDILNSAWFLDILKYTDFWKSKNELWISKNQIMDILNSVWFLDIQKCILGYKIHWFLDIQKWIMDIQISNYGYPKFSMIFGYPKMYFRISISQFLDIQKWIMDIQKWIMDIQKSIYGYPKLHFWIISIIILRYPKFIFWYPKMN